MYGVDADTNGSLCKSEFDEFVRQTLVADLPATVVDALQAAHDGAARRSTTGLVDRTAAAELLRSIGIGFPANDMSTEELLDVMDADGSGDVSMQELLAGVGMLRRQQKEMATLEQAFKAFLKPPKNRCRCRFCLQRLNGAQGSGELSATHIARLLGIPLPEVSRVIPLPDCPAPASNEPSSPTQHKRATRAENDASPPTPPQGNRARWAPDCKHA